MSNKHFDAEQKAEALLQALGEAMGESRAEYAMFLMEENPEPQTKVKGTRRRTRRIVILAAVLVLAMALALVISDGVKLKKASVVTEETPSESTRIIDESKQELNPADFVVGYVPEGYHLEKDEVYAEGIREISYIDGKGHSIRLFIVKTEKYTHNVDNERLTKEEILINDKQAYLFYEEDYSCLIWQIGDCTIDITADLGAEETETIGQHISVQ